MRKLFLIPVMAAVLAIGAPASSAAAHATKFVSITKSAFVPASVAVTTGDLVTWTNSDSANHQVVSQTAGFASPILKPGETFTYQFSKAGKFGYHDALTKATGSGTVTVANAPVVVTATLSANVKAITYGARSVTLS